jgi:tetratricopeptide (TPR) repeat protein
VIVSLGVILFVAVEIMAGLVWLTSASRTGGQHGPAGRLGFGNLLAVSGLYFMNLILLWLKNTTIIDWDVLTVSPFVIWLISAGLGFWGFRRLCQQRDDVNYPDAGAWLYLGLVTWTTATIAYAFATANDPLIEVFEDAIVYSHLAMGLAFLLYIVLNFRDLYAQRLAVYKVMYKPRRGAGQGYQLVWFRLAGLVVTGLLFGNANFFSLRQAAAGYYNGLGDLNVATGEGIVAEAFYRQALQQDYRHRKANLALATLAQQQNNPATAAQYLEQSLLKQPSPQAYTALSQTFLTTNLFFEGIKILQRGLRAFPQNGELQNNLGYLYARTAVADSAYFYLQSATENTRRAEVPQTNLLAFWARNPALIAADSSAVAVTNSAYESYRANALGLRRLGLLPRSAMGALPVPTVLTRPETPEALGMGQFAGMYNYALLTSTPDTTLTARLGRLSQNPANQSLTDDLLLARALAEYTRHDPTTVFSLLTELAHDNARTGPTYRQTAGLLLLDQGLFGLSAAEFAQNPDTLSAFYRALALTKAGRLEESRPVWEIAGTTDPLVMGLKQSLFGEKSPASDLEKAFYVSYRPDDANRGRIWETIRDPNLHTAASATLIQHYIQTRQPFYAAMILSQLKPATSLNAFSRSLQNLSAVRVAVARHNGKAALSLARQSVVDQHEPERQRLIGQAYLLLNQPAEARQTLAEAARLAPLDARIITDLATLERQQRQSASAYRRVVAALPFHNTDTGLLKLYVQLCLDQGLTQYADDGLLRLELATPPADYQAFARVYQARLTQIEKQRQAFAQ